MVALVRLRVMAVKVGNSVRVAIPREILDASGVKEGDTLYIDYDETSRRILISRNGTRA